jgi:hypothetical protein
MSLTSNIRLVPAMAVLAVASVFGAPSNDENVQVREGKNEFTLTVPVSDLTMSIPKNGLSKGKNTQEGSADNPGYFFFEDDREDVIIVSGWFESQEKFLSPKEVWEEDTKQWSRQGLPAPTNVSFQKIDGWDAVVYDVPVPGGSNTHIRAHWVKAGTWIDLHLSITSERPIGECRQKMRALLKRIRVREKK